MKMQNRIKRAVKTVAFGVALPAMSMLLLVGCQKESWNTVPQGFRLSASMPSTRLALEDDHSTVEWLSSDCLFLVPVKQKYAGEYPYTLKLDPKSLVDHNTHADFVYDKFYTATGWNRGRDLPEGEYDVVYADPRLNIMVTMSTADSLVFTNSLLSVIDTYNPHGLLSATMFSPGTIRVDRSGRVGAVGLRHTCAMIGMPIMLESNGTGQEVYLDSVRIVAKEGNAPFPAFMHIDWKNKSKEDFYAYRAELKRYWRIPVKMDVGESVFAHIVAFPTETGDVTVSVFVHLEDGTKRSFDFERPSKKLEAGYHYDVEIKRLNITE